MTGEATIRVVLADDHQVVRTGLRLLLDREPGIEVVAEAGTVPETAEVTSTERPDVLVLDLNMPGARTSTSLELLPGLAASAPDTAVVVLTMQDDPGMAREALAAGVRGYVLKEAADSELVTAIREAASGGVYLNPRLGALVASGTGDDADTDLLTLRERDVLRLIGLGHTNTEIAEQLFLSVRTIEAHRAQIQRKLGVSKRAELVRFALDNGLLD